eukprot:jgi/Mesvir1/10563/Mv21785-RA.4
MMASNKAPRAEQSPPVAPQAASLTVSSLSSVHGMNAHVEEVGWWVVAALGIRKPCSALQLHPINTNVGIQHGQQLKRSNVLHLTGIHTTENGCRLSRRKGAFQHGVLCMSRGRQGTAKPTAPESLEIPGVALTAYYLALALFIRKMVVENVRPGFLHRWNRVMSDAAGRVPKATGAGGGGGPFHRWLRRLRGGGDGDGGDTGLTGNHQPSSTDLPEHETTVFDRYGGATTIYDRHGTVVAQLFGADQAPWRLDDLPAHLVQAVVASEDSRFFHHFGVDPLGIARAFLGRGSSGSFTSGGSTVTQQLAKNLFLFPNRTFSRKVVEMVTASLLEMNLSKRKIMEAYLNKCYWGHGAVGIEAAALTYFGKRPSELTVGECALMVGILPSPEYLSPFQDLEAAQWAKCRVVTRMVEAGLLHAGEADSVKKEEIVLNHARPETHGRAPWFVSEDYAQNLISTTKALQDKEEASIVVIEPAKVEADGTIQDASQSGAVRVLVGGKDYSKSSYNRATRAYRSPGSIMKPIVYLAALGAGLRTSERILDEPVSFNGFIPFNYDRAYHGTVTIEDSLRLSLNVPAVHLCNMVGPERVKQLARRLGVRSKMPSDLGLALGGCEVSPLEMASVYATMAGCGVAAPPHFVRAIYNSEGKLLYSHIAQAESVIAADAVARLNQMLRKAVDAGTAYKAAIGRPVCGKTGTSQESRDCWMAGYTPQFSCVLWVGHDDNTPMQGSPAGGGLAAPLWSDAHLPEEQAQGQAAGPAAGGRATGPGGAWTRDWQRAADAGAREPAGGGGGCGEAHTGRAGGGHRVIGGYPHQAAAPQAQEEATERQEQLAGGPDDDREGPREGAHGGRHPGKGRRHRPRRHRRARRRAARECLFVAGTDGGGARQQGRCGHSAAHRWGGRSPPHRSEHGQQRRGGAAAPVAAAVATAVTAGAVPEKGWGPPAVRISLQGEVVKLCAILTILQ